jgi:hypothetical protein
VDTPGLCCQVRGGSRVMRAVIVSGSQHSGGTNDDGLDETC